MGVTCSVAPTFLFGGFRPAGRGARSVLSSDGKNQRSPGDGSDERLRGAGAHSHLSPGPPVTGAGPFGLLLSSGGLNFDRAPLSTRPTGAYCHQDLQVFALYRTPPGAPLPVWCGRHRLPGCHSFARLGGVRTARILSNFYLVGACAPEARRKQGLVFEAAGRKCPSSRRASSVAGGPGGNAYEHRRKPGVHRRKPPGAFLVPFWASKKEHSSLW